jgi:tetratricopeptide (TPR) repeat protein
MRRYITVTTTIIWFICSSVALAQTKKPKLPDKFPPSPLEITTPDPLVPVSVKKQSLTLEELQKLELALDQLNQEATAKMQAGDKTGAFEIWNRELRLRRYLGSLAEVQALSRVGTIAWNENDRQQVQYITQRLQKIQKSEKTPNLELLQALGEAYTTVRSPSNALQVYEQVLATVRQQQDTVREIETLTTIAELHLSWFDYPKAAASYEQLLGLASSRGERVNEITYLQELAYIYRESKQYQLAANTRTKLVEIYQSQNQLIELPALQMAIASDYESLGKENPSLLEQAFKNYEDAYINAWQLQQYVIASEALQKLIALYRSQGQIEEALQTSQILIEAEKLAVNYYGIMNAYDQIGQMYVERKEYPQAITAFQQGLELAQQLKHEENYFTEQIQKLSGL